MAVPSTGEPVRDAFRQAVMDATVASSSTVEDTSRDDVVRQHVRRAHDAAVAADDKPVNDIYGDEDEEGDVNDAAEAETTETVEAKTTDTATTEKPAETGELVTDAEFKALQAEHKDDPVALKNSLLKVFTQKTQRLAEERRGLERYQQYGPVLDAFEADPVATIRALAEQYDLELPTSGESKTVASATAKTAAAATTVTTEAERAELLADFKEKLGPELEYLADALLPALEGLIDKRTSAALKPIQARTERLVAGEAEKQTESIMASLTEKHPDWKTHEKAMQELAHRYKPDAGMTELEYLDGLYKIATYEAMKGSIGTQVQTETAKQVKAALEKMAKGATTAARDGARTTATPDEQVRKRPAKAPTFREAAKAAFAGERFDDDDE